MVGLAVVLRAPGLPFCMGDAMVRSLGRGIPFDTLALWCRRSPEARNSDWGDRRVSSLGDPIWYFSYGSNMNRAILTGRRGLHPQASAVGWLDDHRLCFNLPVGPGERGVANLEPERGARTCGVLHLLTPEGCDRLDRTEGVHVGVYRRVPVAVRADPGERVVAAFTYRSSRTVLGRKPSPRYMRLLLDGAAEHGLPGDWVQFLEGFELAVDERDSVNRS